VTVLRAKSVEVEADRAFAVYADGEHVTDTPVTVSVLPGVLRVIAPAPA
jgi:diacylglycerol kinase family enzyme